jgi:hypothetical protein
MKRAREEIIVGENESDSEVEFMLEIRAPSKRFKKCKPLPPNVQVVDVEKEQQ